MVIIAGQGAVLCLWIGSSKIYFNLIGSRGQVCCPLDFTGISDSTFVTSYAYTSDKLPHMTVDGHTLSK